MDKVIKAVLRSGAITAGHAIFVDLLLEDGGELTVECRHENTLHIFRWRSSMQPG
jgi:hypothetical protein